MCCRYFYLDGLRVVEVGAEVHEELWHPGGDVVGAGQDAGAEPQHTRVALHQICNYTTLIDICGVNDLV